MSILGNDLLLAGTDEGYNLTRSLRFRSSASAYLNRTPASTGNRKTFTLSGWVKRGALGINGTLFANGNGVNANGYFTIRFNTNDTISIFNDNDGTLTTCDWSFTNVFRDVAAWYHLILVADTTQATQTNRIKLYVNGVENTNRSVTTYPSQNSDLNINRTVPHQIGQFGFGSSQYFDGYLTEINFIDGQALTPSSFGETDTTTGVWKPKRYAGTYGTNGFYLPFTDNSALTTSSNAGLGKDFSGNGNYWTTNNISITAGTTYDSMTDVPTLTSATAANFAVLNPLDSGRTLSNGNLTYAGAASGITKATFGVSSGKWYWEFTAGNTECMVGLCAITLAPTTSWIGSSSGGWGYFGTTGLKYVGGSGSSYGASYTTNDIIGVAFDADNGTLAFYKNGTSQGTAFTGITGSTYCPANGNNSTSDSGSLNFGQRPFTYTPPTGYVALNTYNLPTSTIVKGNTVMDATLYTGNGGTQAVTNAGGFKPDLVWLKSRSAAYDHLLFDSIRGTGKALFSSSTAAETTTNNMSAFNSNGFTALYDATYIGSNNSGVTMVGWQWQAGQGTTSSNTNGTITSTVSVNASAGFSIVTYTGNGTNGATVGHGLGVKPSLIIEKGRASTYSWVVQGCGVLWPTATQTLFLNNTSGLNAGSGIAAPTSSVFTPASLSYANESGLGYVAYCWTPIAGYSAFSSYSGNGSADGPMIYTGFQPKWVMIKRTDSGNNWFIVDAARNTYNLSNAQLLPNSSAAESTNTDCNIDILSNGFKLRTALDASNGSGGTYIYAAFATAPFKNSLAR